MRAIRENPPPTLSGERWSAEFVDFVSQCLVKDVKDRAALRELIDAGRFWEEWCVAPVREGSGGRAGEGQLAEGFAWSLWQMQQRCKEWKHCNWRHGERDELLYFMYCLFSSFLHTIIELFPSYTNGFIRTCNMSLRKAPEKGVPYSRRSEASILRKCMQGCSFAV